MNKGIPNKMESNEINKDYFSIIFYFRFVFKLYFYQK